MRNLMFYSPHHIFKVIKSNQGQVCGTCGLCRGKREIDTGFLWGNLKEEVLWEDRLRWEVNIKVDINERAV
jgi:hypothetical protein